MNNSSLFKISPIRQLINCIGSAEFLRAGLQIHEAGRHMQSNREYFGGYCRSNNVMAVIDARRAGQIAKNELRLFFATLEHEQTGCHVPVDVILNKHRKQKKRITTGVQEQALSKLSVALNRHKKKGAYGVKLPRKFVRTAAAGLLDVSAMIVGLYYFTKRMPQRSRRKSLIRGERYGRLSVRTIREATGLCFDVIIKALRLLRTIKLIALVWRPMQEVKRYGRLFVDGLRVSISYQKPERSRASAPSARLQKTRAVAPEKSNEKKETLNKNSLIGSLRYKRDEIGAFAARYCPDHPKAIAYLAK